MVAALAQLYVGGVCVAEFRATFGEADTGIITGDVCINPEASCLILTTEILRSMLYKGADVLRDLAWVIFDEVHYVNDAERGVVWEEVIIMLPPHVNFVLLSATVPNTLEFADWVGRTKRKNIWVISTDKRPVPLQHFLWTKHKLFQVMDGQTGRFITEGFKKAREEGLTAKVQAQQKRGFFKRPSLRQARSSWVVLIQYLQKNDLLPVVIFAFSKKVCEECAFGLPHLDLTTSAEKSEITVAFAAALARLQVADRQLPQVLRVKELVRRGLGLRTSHTHTHHSHMPFVPLYMHAHVSACCWCTVGGRPCRHVAAAEGGDRDAVHARSTESDVCHRDVGYGCECAHQVRGVLLAAQA